tara:strand:+ start:1006 stop:1209 length:204 start_codon:yes stop_codon:yes gene_type:complete
MTEKKRKFVVNCAFAIVKVCVTYAACLNIDYHFSGPRVWHLNSFDGHRSAFRSSYDAANFMWHLDTP